MSRPCDSCGTTIGEVQRSLASSGSYLCEDCHSKEAKASASTESAEQEPAALRASSSLVPSPSSLVSLPGQKGSEKPEVEQLLEMHEAGGIEPVPVWLPPLPEGAPPGVRCVYEFYELVYGLRSWAADDRPVPFACGWVAKKLGIPKTTAWRALKVLVGAGVLEHAGQMPARGKRGTDLYSPVSTAAEESKVVPIRRGS